MTVDGTLSGAIVLDRRSDGALEAMPTVVTATLEPDGFPLSRTLGDSGDVECECDRVVTSVDTVRALMWLYTPEAVAVEELLDADPSVGEYVLMTEVADGVLYRQEWVRDIAFLQHVMRDAKATVLDAYGTGQGWRLCLTYPNHEGVRSTRAFAESRDLTFQVTNVRSIPDGPLDRFGLTTQQYEALYEAWRLGYFDVPRSVDLQRVAAELGISQQAASERLRRGHETLVREFLGTAVREYVHRS